MECYFDERDITACSQFGRQRGNLLQFMAVLIIHVGVLHLQYLPSFLISSKVNKLSAY